jgi:hypothetical protein
VAQNLIGTLYDDNGHAIASTQTGRTATGLSATYAALAVTGMANPANATAAANVIPTAGMAWNGATFDLPAAAVAGVPITTTGGTTTAAVASGTSSNTVIKATPGRLARVLVTGLAGTTTGTTSIFDNATTNSGTVLAILANNTAVGTVLTFDMPAANGITVGGNANAPAVTISFL